MSAAAPETTLRLPDAAVRAAPGVDAAALAAALRGSLPRLDPRQGEAALRTALAPDGELQRWRHYRAVVHFRGGPLGAVHAKVYRPKDALDRVLGAVLTTRARTSWRMGRKLRAAGLPTPEPVLLWEGADRTSVLLTRPLPAPVLLADELKRLSPREARPLLREVARLVARLHEAGFFHGDLTVNNVLRAEGGLWLIDLDRTKDLRALPAALRASAQCIDLRMLLLSSWRQVSRPAWLRLIAEYLRARRLPRPARKRAAARILSARRGRIRLGARPRTGTRVPWT